MFAASSPLSASDSLLAALHFPLLLLYLAVGPLAWLVIAYLMTIGRERMIKLRKSRAVLSSDPPLISILIPARNEGANIRACLERVMGQDYPNVEVIAIDDRSTDDTGQILDHCASSSVRVVHVHDLPQGWLGKCHALDEGAKHARGDWLFFVDSDVKLQPEALSKMVALSIERSYDAMSIMTTLETHRFVERLMLPLLASTWATMFAADQTNEDSQPQRALANGQVFLIRTSAYRAVGGHEAVKDRIVEDVELMRTLKAAGFKTRFLAGRHLASTRMHTHLKQMFHGWARIFAGTGRGAVMPMIVAIAFLLACVLSVYAAGAVAIAAGSWGWGSAALAHFAIMTVAFGFMWHWSGNSPVYALLLPISVPIEIAILVFSIVKAWSGVVEWRGMMIDLRRTSQQSTPEHPSSK